MLLTQVPRFARAERSRCLRGFAALWLFNTRRQAHVLLANHSSSLRGLTFELSGRRRQDARPGPVTMYGVPQARAWWPAVGAPLERVVRPHWAGKVSEYK